MPQRTQQPNEKPIHERRTPLGNDLDPDGMDSETEGDELKAGFDEDADVHEGRDTDGDVVNGPDGASDRRSTGQSRTSGTHGEAPADIATERNRR